MVFTIYTRPDGAYVLVPECMRATLEAEKLHGPLTYCDHIDSDDYPLPAVWERVMTETDEHSFAVLQESVGRQLLGIACPDDAAG